MMVIRRCISAGRLFATATWLIAAVSGRAQELPCATLPVPYACQEHETWCWAACAQMIMDSYGTRVDQCKQVTAHATKDCCAPFEEEDTGCNFLGWPHFEEFGFRVTTNDFPLTWEELVEQICVKRQPFAASWGPGDGRPGGHMVVVVGYFTLDGVRMVAIQNPNPWCGSEDYNPDAPTLSAMSYDQYANGRQQGEEHLLDFFAAPTLRIIVQPIEAITNRVVRGPGPEPDPYHKPSLAALNALSGFTVQGTNFDVHPYGFHTRHEIKKARLGVPLEVYLANLAEIQKPRRRAHAEVPLTPAGEMIYPLIVGRQVRSSVTVRHRGHGWRVSGFGDARLIRLLTTARERSAQRALRSPASYFAVRLPVGRNTCMVAHRQDDELILTPILDDPRLGLEAGRDVPAANVFAALAPLARQAKGFPPIKPTQPKGEVRP